MRILPILRHFASIKDGFLRDPRHQANPDRDAPAPLPACSAQNYAHSMRMATSAASIARPDSTSRAATTTGTVPDSGRTMSATAIVAAAATNATASSRRSLRGGKRRDRTGRNRARGDDGDEEVNRDGGWGSSGDRVVRGFRAVRAPRACRSCREPRACRVPENAAIVLRPPRPIEWWGRVVGPGGRAVWLARMTPPCSGGPSPG